MRTRSPRRPVPARRAFTLVELLVVVGIIALLIAILLPSLNKARESASRAKCASNLHQIGLGIMLYEQANADEPPATIASPAGLAGARPSSPFRTGGRAVRLP